MTDQELNQRFGQITDTLEHLAQAQIDTDREINALVSAQRETDREINSLAEENRNILASLKLLNEITSTHTAQIVEIGRHLQAYLTTVHPRQ